MQEEFKKQRKSNNKEKDKFNKAFFMFCLKLSCVIIAVSVMLFLAHKSLLTQDILGFFVEVVLWFIVITIPLFFMSNTFCQRKLFSCLKLYCVALCVLIVAYVYVENNYLNQVNDWVKIQGNFSKECSVYMEEKEEICNQFAYYLSLYAEIEESYLEYQAGNKIVFSKKHLILSAFTLLTSFMAFYMVYLVLVDCFCAYLKDKKFEILSVFGLSCRYQHKPKSP